MADSVGGEPIRSRRVVPVVERFLDDCETPVSAFLKLRAVDGLGDGPAFMLESAEQGQVGRYTFLGFSPNSLLRWADGELRAWHGDAARDPDSAATAIAPEPDPYGAASRYMAAHDFDCDSELENLLPPFEGGAVGFFGYDLVRTVERLAPPNPDPLGLPDMALMMAEVMVVFDHLKRDLIVISYAFIGEGDDEDAALARARERITAVRDGLAGPIPGFELAPAPDLNADPGPGSSDGVRFKSNMSREQFEANVSTIIEYIRAGDAFQIVPSQRFSAPAPKTAFSIYRGLRAVNPSPYMYYLDFGDFQLAGTSPEPLIKVTGRRVETRPIAGTYPRGKTPEEDRANAEALVSDPKERAEHVMLVDLGRNDLGRVCEYGTVTVDELMRVEAYSHVFHIVSLVSGTLREDAGCIDALRAVLPAGTLSGAPKVRAMEIIDEVEPHKRGSYGGAIGYLGFNGDLDTAIHIRTVVVKDGTAHVQAGGGTVVDAKPEYEYQESVNKAKAIFKAVELAASQPGWE